MSIAVTANRPKSVNRVTLHLQFYSLCYPKRSLTPLKLEIRATNVYAKLSKGWKYRLVLAAARFTVIQTTSHKLI
jgi:hypothetical protein